MGAVDAYILLIVVTALTVAPFSALARIVVLAWIVGHIAWLGGLPEPWANLGGQLTVFVLGRRHLHGGANTVAWGISLVLIVVNGVWILGRIDPGVAWLLVAYTAMAQLFVLPFGIDREMLTGVAKVWHHGQGGGLLRTRST